MGTVARCCTSCGDAPGICTNTSSMGTTICGSSSRGVIRIAKAPASSAPAMNSGVSFELMKVRAISPAMRSGVFPSAAIVISPRFACRSIRARPAAPRCAHRSPVLRGPRPGWRRVFRALRIAGSRSRLSPPRTRRPTVRDAAARFAGTRIDSRSPRAKRARPNSPERICGFDGSSILTVNVRLAGSAIGTIWTTLPAIV